jgi:2EXR family
MEKSKPSSSNSFDAKKPRFTLFPKLPIELRLKIWKESYEPRIIELRFAQKWNMCRYDFIIPKFPPVLHVNKEARLESLKYYKFSFKHRHCRRPVLFNFSIDTLHIRDCTPDGQSMLGRQNTMRILPDKEKVQKLSVTFGAFRISSLGGGIPSAPVILLFPALKEVTVCSPITESIDFQQDGEFYLHSHLGKCVRVSDASSCFPKNSKLTLTPESGAQPISNIIESFFRFEKSLVDDFLHNLRSGEWGGTKWQEPSFGYRGLCLKGFSHSHELFYCPPRQKYNRRTRRHTYDSDEELPRRHDYGEV